MKKKDYMIYYKNSYLQKNKLLIIIDIKVFVG